MDGDNLVVSSRFGVIASWPFARLAQCWVRGGRPCSDAANSAIVRIPRQHSSAIVSPVTDDACGHKPPTPHAGTRHCLVTKLPGPWDASSGRTAGVVSSMVVAAAINCPTQHQWKATLPRKRSWAWRRVVHCWPNTGTTTVGPTLARCMLPVSLPTADCYSMTST